MQNERARARVGSVLLEKWHLDALIGVGGMAAVYSATHHNGRRVAIKILHGELASVIEAKERFLEEAYAANQVSHPGTVPVLDDGETADGCAFLVMELLEGETLDARMRRAGGTLPVIEVLALTDALLDVLSAAHGKGTIHRDVKPENVFLTTRGNVKLLDFGIARVRETRRTLRTQTGATMGTPAFMSPEQARGRWDEVDGRADLWSVGASMFTLLSGRLVHDGETANEQLLAAMTQSAPPLESVAPLVPACVVRIVDRALAARAYERFDSALSMQAVVRSAHAYLVETAAAEGRLSTPPLAGGPIEPFYIPGLNRDTTTCRPVTATEPPTSSRRPLSLFAAAGALLAGGLFLAVHWLADDTAARPAEPPALAVQPVVAPSLDVEDPKKSPRPRSLHSAQTRDSAAASSDHSVPTPPTPLAFEEAERVGSGPSTKAGVAVETKKRSAAALPVAPPAASPPSSAQATPAPAEEVSPAPSSPAPASPTPEGPADPLSRRR